MLFCKILTAQKISEITFTPYNTSDIGTYQSLGIKYALNKAITLRGEITYHDNMINMPDRNQELYFRKRFHANNSAQHVGFILGIEHSIKLTRNNGIRAYGFFEIGYRNIGAKSYRWIPASTFQSQDNTIFLISEKRYTQIDALNSFETILGMGISAKMFYNFYFFSNFGAGINIVAGVPKNILDTSIFAEYSLKYSLGISYNF